MADEVVVDSNRKNLIVTLVDENNAVINLTGGSAKLQGRSDDLPSKTIDATGNLSDPAQGQVTFASIGTLVSASDLGSLKKATFNLRVKFHQSPGAPTGLFDYSPKFQIDWVEPPIPAAP